MAVCCRCFDPNLSITLFLCAYFFLVQGSESARVDGTTVEVNYNFHRVGCRLPLHFEGALDALDFMFTLVLGRRHF